ncbi:MAG: response regulator [Thermodesulfobacteriota bacterium]|nr:response regulator [Thermodesulfobacteriota bacterium]
MTIGLGLTIVWNTVHDYDGYIDVQTEDKGIFFRLYFPVTRDLADQIPEDTAEKDLRGRGETELVVDDQKSQRVMLCEMLNHLGYAPYAVSSGEAAVKYIRHNQVDIIILDMLMEPGLNGRQTFEKILEINPHQKAIIASGYSKNEDVVMAQKSGAGQFIKKPFTLEKLSAALKDELNR